ncbi:MAG TPA: FkbM family methyltransferase [Tardiphaga sp.]
MKHFLKLAAKRVGFTVTRAPDLLDFLTSRSINIVYDVGANKGQFAKELRFSGYRGRIISFEPIPSVFAELEKQLSGDSAWEGHCAALGTVRSKGTINVSENTVFSSILSQTPYAEKFDPSAKVARIEEIDIIAFDDVYRHTPDTRAFLKIDTQGFERQVLDGAKRALKHLHGLQLELPIQHLYQDDWTLPTALTFLNEIGFVPAQMHPTNYINHDRQCWTEIDCIFRRSYD